MLPVSYSTRFPPGSGARAGLARRLTSVMDTRWRPGAGFQKSA